MSGRQRRRQHRRFLAHPEVYVLILPALGIVVEIVANNTRKPLFGYKSMVYSPIFLAYVVRRVGAPHAHDRYGHDDGHVLQTTTMTI